MLARYSEPGGDGRLTLELAAEGGEVIAQETVEAATLTHNQTFTFRFPIQKESAGRSYTLTLRGDPANTVTAWGYDLDAYAGGALTVAGLDPGLATTQAQDLRLLTRYQLTFDLALARLGESLRQNGGLLALALTVLVVPGCLLLLAGRRAPFRLANCWVWWGIALAAGVAAWPIVWLWLTTLGGRWNNRLLWLVWAAGWVGAFYLWRRLRKQGSKGAGKQGSGSSPLLPRPSAPPPGATLLLLLALGLAVRLLAVRDLALPPWVDSGRHALITRLMAESGQTVSGYRPYLPIDNFPYHFGFHTLSAGLLQMTGWPLPRLLLILGQLLNALIPLTLYTAAWLVTRRRGASTLAAFLVALPFFFPAYYATWGRFTQLAAMLLMPVLLALTWLLVRGGRAWRRVWWLVGLLAAGVFLIHFRVFLLYVPYAGLVLLLGKGRHARWLLAAAGLALLLVAPHLWQLVAATEPAALVATSIPGYNDFPTGYLLAGWERYFVLLAAFALLLTIPATLRRRPWVAFPLTLAAWVSLLFLFLSGSRLGLPESGLINLNSMYITLFAPEALLLAVVIGRVARWRPLTKDEGRSSRAVETAPTPYKVGLRRLWAQPAQAGLANVAATSVARRLLLTVYSFSLTAALLFGVHQQVTILNPQTILAGPADLAALQWVGQNLPETAYLAVNSWKWLGTTWAGSDGGAWLLPLTGRQSTTPPADYIYSEPLALAVDAFNQAATGIQDWSTPEAADWLGQQGVTHVFAGARGGFFDPSALARNPAMRLVYGRDGVFIFALK